MAILPLAGMNYRILSEQFTYVTPSGLTACVWDLCVQCFERQAGVDCVLANPDGPDLKAYVAATSQFLECA
jgi:hypothetical protein